MTSLMSAIRHGAGSPTQSNRARERNKKHQTWEKEEITFSLQMS